MERGIALRNFVLLHGRSLHVAWHVMCACSGGMLACDQLLARVDLLLVDREENGSQSLIYKHDIFFTRAKEELNYSNLYVKCQLNCSN
jgi:hypothetical protein